MAAEHGLIVADKPDSQTSVSLPDGNYAGVIEKLRPGVVERVISLIKMARFWASTTVLFITPSVNGAVWASKLADPLYVVELDVDKKHVIVGPKEL